jgi:hypothetical protein
MNGGKAFSGSSEPQKINILAAIPYRSSFDLAANPSATVKRSKPHSNLGDMSLDSPKHGL